jgi:hypothetical protein
MRMNTQRVITHGSGLCTFSSGSLVKHVRASWLFLAVVPILLYGLLRRFSILG